MSGWVPLDFSGSLELGASLPPLTLPQLPPGKASPAVYLPYDGSRGREGDGGSGSDGGGGGGGDSGGGGGGGGGAAAAEAEAAAAAAQRAAAAAAAAQRELAVAQGFDRLSEQVKSACLQEFAAFGRYGGGGDPGGGAAGGDPGGGAADGGATGGAAAPAAQRPPPSAAAQRAEAERLDAQLLTLEVAISRHLPPSPTISARPPRPSAARQAENFDYAPADAAKRRVVSDRHMVPRDERLTLALSIHPSPIHSPCPYPFTLTLICATPPTLTEP